MRSGARSQRRLRGIRSSARVPPSGSGRSDSVPPSSESTSVRTICRPEPRRPLQREGLRQAHPVVGDVDLQPARGAGGDDPHGARDRLRGRHREAVLEGVGDELGHHQDQRRRHHRREHARPALPVQLHPGARPDEVVHHRHHAGEHLVDVDPLVDRRRQRLVDQRDRRHPAHRLRQRRAGLLVAGAAGLQAQQGRDRLQVVLHAVVDLADRRVLAHQRPVAAPHLGDVPDEHQRAGRDAAGLQGQRPHHAPWLPGSRSRCAPTGCRRARRAASSRSRRPRRGPRTPGGPRWAGRRPTSSSAHPSRWNADAALGLA